MRLSLQGKWFLSLVGLAGVLLAALALGLNSLIPRHITNLHEDHLRQTAQITASLIPETPRSREELQSVLTSLQEQYALRFTLIRSDGVVWADSGVKSTDVDRLENHRSRPEIAAALEQGEGFAIRRSDTLGTDLMYAASRTTEGSVLRLARPVADLRELSKRIRSMVFTVALGLAPLAVFIAYRIARRVTAPIDAMRAAAERYAAGDLTRRSPEEGGIELVSLGRALNQMREQLGRQLHELADEKSELQATLATMVEGVLLVDAGGRIRLMNAALRATFGLSDDALGRTLLETFRHRDLNQLVDDVISGIDNAAAELVFAPDQERFFNVSAARLRNGGPEGRGAVVVFHNVTRIRQLEKVRRDFVANASHELRTPLAVIRGYVETLMDSPPEDQEAHRMFLGTIDRNVRRLESLLRDLLSISELESHQARLERAPVQLQTMVDEVFRDLKPASDPRQITLHNQIATDVPPVLADARLLHQVFTNLVENAVKYTPAGSEVRVTASREDDTVIVCVEDNGPGIADEHLTRIFERFYRVDRARSRELGGTGLGLSIVKHIVLAHGGRVWAESRLGQGSRFYFTVQTA